MPASRAEKTLFYFVIWWVWEQPCSYSKQSCLMATVSDWQDFHLLLCLPHPHLKKRSECSDRRPWYQ